MIELLLGPAGNVQVNSQAKNGLTALHLAAQENHIPTAQVLIDHSCTIDPQTKVFSLCFHIFTHVHTQFLLYDAKSQEYLCLPNRHYRLSAVYFPVSFPEITCIKSKWASRGAL